MTNAAIKRCLGVHSKAGLMDRGGIEELSRRQEISRLIHLAIERCQDYNKKSIENLYKSARYRCVEEVSRLLKNSFSRREKNIDMNAIKHATQPRIQTSF